jgi:uncharacterized protein
MMILLILASCYGLLALAVMLGQRTFIYFPGKLSLDEALRIAQEERFQPWRNDDGTIIGWQRPSEEPARASVLIVHGNGGYALGRDYLASSIHQTSGVDVFVLEYPGYGARSGSPSMRSFLDAADEAFTQLPAGRPVYLVAESLGTGVAAHLAKKYPAQVAGVVFFAPYNDLASVGQRQMPVFPVKLLLRDRFQPSQWLSHYRGPIHVVLAEQDRIIPQEFGRKLYDQFQGSKTLEVIAGAGHNDIAAQPVDWWRDLFRTWEEKRSR